MEIISCLIFGGIGVAAWRVAWLNQYRKLMGKVNQKIDFREIGELTGDYGINPAEIAAYGGITFAEFLWSWATIDPHLIDAASFSSTQPIHNGFDFVRYIHEHYDSLNEAGKQGFLNRLSGYYAEQQARDILIHAGHSVHVADTSNQPVWDFIVDHHLVNIKDVANMSSIKADALTHPGVIYIVPTDAHGQVIDNIDRLNGLNHQQIHDAIQHGLSQAHGTSALELSNLHMPIFTILFAIARNTKQVIRDDKDIDAAVTHTMKEIITKGTGVVIGGQIGGTIGTILCPGFGTLVGSVIGAIAGGIGGAFCGEKWKRHPLNSAIAHMEMSLAEYGKSYSSKIRDIMAYIDKPIRDMNTSYQKLQSVYEQRASSLRYKLWPDMYTVMVERSLVNAKQQIDDLKRMMDNVKNIVINAAQKGDWKQLGLLMATEPNIRSGIGSNDALLHNINQARRRVWEERKKLDPSFKYPDS